MSQASPGNRHPENQAAMSEEDLAALRQLHHVIDEEMRKPLEEQDEELISECIETIAEIKGVKGSFSAEEIDEQIAIVKAKAAQEKAARQPKRIRKPVLIAACAVLLAAVSMITAYANPTLRAWFVQMKQSGIGAMMMEQGITYQYMGESILYDSVDELLTEEGIQIYYPTVLPKGVLIELIECLDINGDKVYNIKFNTTDISMTIQTNRTSLLSSNSLREEYNTSIGLFYIYAEENLSRAVGLIDQSLYSLTVNRNIDIKTIVDSLREDNK